MTIFIKRFMLQLLKKLEITQKKPFTRLCSASSLPPTQNFQGYKILYNTESVDLEKPLFYLEKEEQANAVNYFPWKSQKAYQAGIISVNKILVSFPYLLHRWKGKIFREALGDSSRVLNYASYLINLETMPFLRKIKMPEAVLLAMPGCDNYYHWTVEIIPRLKMIEEDNKLSQLPLILPKSISPIFIQESLKKIGVLEKAIFLEDGVYEFDTLHIPSLFSPASHPSRISVDWLRQKFIEQTSTEPEKKKRIYLSRKNTKSRFTINESEVERLLSEFGFETYCMSDYSLEEQIKIFQQAKIIIGNHGAALTNLAFTSSDAIVIELLHTPKTNPCYFILAALRKIQYGYFVVQKNGAGIYVDIDDLRSLIQKVLLTIEN